MAYLYDLTDTWNAAGTVFNAIKMNVTNTASAAGSKIVSLQVGATDRFTVDKDGNGYFSGTLQAVGSISTPNLYIGANSGTIGMQDNTASILAYNATGSGGITNTLRFITGAAERVRIDGSGNVGIGTSSPGVKLDVVGAGVFRVDGSGTTTPLILRNNNTASVQAVKLGFDSSGAIKSSINAAVYGNDYMTFNVGSDTERMRIDSSGNVGIGTSSPGAKLDVVNSGVSQIQIKNTSGTTRNTQLMFADSSAVRWRIGMDVATNNNTNIFQLYNDTAGAAAFSVDTSGNLGLGVTPSASTTFPALEVGAGNCILGASGFVDFTSNAFYNGSYRYKANGAASYYEQTGGKHIWFNAPSGTAGNAISFTQAMTLDASGNLGVGTSSPGTRLDVASAAGSTTAYTALFRSTNTNGYSGLIGIGVAPATAGAYTAAAFAAENSNGTANDGGRLKFYTAADDASHTLTERARIDSSGNLLVGTTSGLSGAKTEIRQNADANYSTTFTTGTTKNLLTLRDLSDVGTYSTPFSTLAFAAGSSAAAWATITGVRTASQSSAIAFGTANGSSNTEERMRIDSSGNLLVGTTSVAYTNTNSAFISVGNGCYNSQHASGTASGSYYAAFVYNATDIGSITQNGTTGVSYNTSSDYRLKDIDGPVQNSGAYIDALKPVQGSWKADGSRFIGLIAHEVQEVSETQIATGVKDGEEMQAMDYSAPELIANLIAEIQSLRARVAQLEGN